MDVRRLEDVHLTTNGVRLHAVAAGSHEGPLVILLHGFPEFWYGWRHQIEPLAWMRFGRPFGRPPDPRSARPCRFDFDRGLVSGTSRRARSSDQQ